MADDSSRLVRRAAEFAAGYLDGLDDRPVLARASYDEMLETFRRPLPDGPVDPTEVVETLARDIDPGLTAIGSGRFFGFVMGGSVPAAQAADVLVGAWEQNTGIVFATPGAAAVEHVAAEWLLDLLRLPPDAGVGFVTGGGPANWTCLAAARHHVLAKAGWDVEADGLQGAPLVNVIASDERHVTIDTALKYLGLGAGRTRLVATDAMGRMDVDGLRSALDSLDGPTIVVLAAGNVNTGSFDEFPAAIELAHEAGAWVHVDGAFGLWAAAAPGRRHLVAGIDQADSWATDAHKWLNVPYDCGVAITAHADSHRAAMVGRASYLVHSEGPTDPFELVPEFSRRARGVPVWAALASLGRAGVADMVEQGCAMATRFADGFAATDGMEVLNDVVLNQVLVRFGDDDDITHAVVDGCQREGTAFMTGTTYKGRAAMRVSVCNWRTSADDVDRVLEAVRRVAAEVAH